MKIVRDRKSNKRKKKKQNMPNTAYQYVLWIIGNEKAAKILFKPLKDDSAQKAKTVFVLCSQDEHETYAVYLKKLLLLTVGKFFGNNTCIHSTGKYT